MSRTRRQTRSDWDIERLHAVHRTITRYPVRLWAFARMRKYIARW
jgi:hypothetical protein